MALNAVGLRTHIWNNNFWSLAFLGLYPVILIGLLWVLGGLSNIFLTNMTGEATLFSINLANKTVTNYWLYLFGGVLVWFVISFFYHTRMISKLAHAHPVSRAEETELHNMLENLCITAGVPMPQLQIIETHARNAFASGIDYGSYTITVTRGLVENLSKDEIEAVLAHELTHILNGDVRLLMICIIFTGLLGFAAQLFWSRMRYALYMPRRRSSRSGGSDPRIIIIALAIGAVLWIGYMATVLTRLALSRKREYMADAGAVELTKNPEAMMRALMRISRKDKLHMASADIHMMCIENSVRFFGIFNTHPPIDKRIETLAIMTNTAIPEIKPEKPKLHESVERLNWLTRERPFRKKSNPWRKG